MNGSSDTLSPPSIRSSEGIGHWLAAPWHRYRLYLLVAAALYVAAYALLGLKAYTKHVPMDFLVNDAPGYYAYLPSLVIDHDLDFSNQIVDQFHERGNTVGPYNAEPRWPTGLAVTIFPAFMVAHAASWGMFALTGSGLFEPNGYSVLYQPICAAFIMLIGMWCMVLIDKLLVERFAISGMSIALGVLVYWLGTQYTWYYFREPFMVHGVGAFWVMAVVFIVHRMLIEVDQGKLRGWPLFLLAFSVSMALICRATNAMVLPFFIYLLYRIIKAGLLGRMLAWLPVALLGLAPIVLQLLVQRAIHGSATPENVQQVGYDPREGFRYATDPQLFKILFSSRHGLFFWAPVLTLSVVGLMLHLVRGPIKSRLASARSVAAGLPARWDPVLICFIASAGILWYINSAWYAWWFGSAFGARAFIEISGLFVIGLVFAFEFARVGARYWRYLAGAVVVIGFGVTYLLMAARMLDRIPRDGYLFDQNYHLRGSDLKH